MYFGVGAVSAGCWALSFDEGGDCGVTTEDYDALARAVAAAGFYTNGVEDHGTWTRTCVCSKRRLGGVFPEGFHACMFDGSVHFIGAKIYQDEKALRALIDIRGDKRVDIDSYR